MFSKLPTGILLATLITTGCDQSTAEMRAQQHAEAQSQINAQNFDRANQLREDTKEDPSKKSDQQDDGDN